MRAAFIVPARNKGKYVYETLKTVLSQTYEPLEFLFSDQGSTDNTYEEMERACNEYKGRNEIRLLRCPVDAPHGMTGLNAHMNWLNEQTQADIIIQTSADDLDHEKRAEKVIEAYEKTNASCVHTLQTYMDSNLKEVGYTAWPKEDMFINGVDNINHMVGSSSSMSWSREFYQRMGGIHGIICPDVYLPYLATQDRGLYYIFNNLHAYVQNNSEENTGLEGVMRATEDKEDRLQYKELCQFQIFNTYRHIIFKCQEMFPNWSSDDRECIFRKSIEQAATWARIREFMTFENVPPLPMRI